MVGAVMTMAGYSVLAERKLSAWMQGRRSEQDRFASCRARSLDRTVPQGIGGSFSSLADGLKFLFKEETVPGHANKFYYYLAPLVALVPALTTMTVLPFGEFFNDAGESSPLILADLEVGILFIFCGFFLGVYGIVLGRLVIEQQISLSGGNSFLCPDDFIRTGNGVVLLPVFLWVSVPSSKNSALSLVGLWIPSMGTVVAYRSTGLGLDLSHFLFMETNRLPFDMPESETDLVGGFHTEYGSFKFGIFFVAEYAHIVVGSAIFTTIFLGGWAFLAMDE